MYSEDTLLMALAGWLVSRGKLDKAAKILQANNGHVPGYNVQEVIVSCMFKTV